MGNRGKQYIESVISRIKWKNYHPAIRSELENHMEDGVSELLLEGKTVEEALNITIENMGDPVVLGMQLDEVYKPQYDLRKILMFFLFLFSFSLLKVFALPRMCGEYFSLLLAVCRVVLGSFASLMVFKSDWSNNKKRKSFALIVFWSFIILCILLPLSGFVEKERVIQGILVLLPSCVCFFADRMKEKEELGVFLCVCLFAVPIILSIYSHSFSALLILSLESVIILVFTIKSNWIITRKKPFAYGLVLFSYLALMICVLMRKWYNLKTNFHYFFVKEVIGKSGIYGRSNIVFTEYNGMRDYPLALLISNYGFIMLLLYITFFAVILIQLFEIYRKQQSNLAKLIMVSILSDFVLEFIFSVLLNLGIPLVMGIAVPFLDLRFGIVVKIIQLGIAAKLDCFGNYMFNNFSHNPLFDIKDGKIIIYYK